MPDDPIEQLRQELIQRESDRINNEVRQSLIKDISDNHDRYNNEYTLWALETVKHIALVSLAGLGGVFALVGSNKVPSSDVFWPAVLFGASSICCVLCMYVAMHWRGANLTHQNDLLKRVYQNDFPKPDDYEQTSKIIWIGRVADGFGWLGFFSVCIGAVMLFRVLASLPST